MNGRFIPKHQGMKRPVLTPTNIRNPLIYYVNRYFLMFGGSQVFLISIIHGLLRISCSRNPKTPQIRSFFYKKWLLFGVLRVNKPCFFMQA